MNKLDATDFETKSQTELNLVNALIDCEIENAKLAQKYGRLLEQNPIQKIDLSDTERHRLIFSVRSHIPPHIGSQLKESNHLTTPKTNIKILGGRKKVRKLIVGYVLIAILTYSMVRLFG